MCLREKNIGIIVLSSTNCPAQINDKNHDEQRSFLCCYAIDVRGIVLKAGLALSNAQYAGVECGVVRYSEIP